MNIKSFWHASINKSEIREEILNNNKEKNHTQIKSAYSAISLGTERLVACGNIPKEMFAKMKVPYMGGDFDFPIKYGYSLVGYSSENKLVHLMHPHQSELIANQSDCYVLNENANPIVATQISNLETVINAIWVSKVKANDTVLVCGTGSIGILLAKTLEMYSKAKVFIKETNPEKIEKLVELGFKVCNSKTEYDICYNVSSSEKGLQYCIDHCVVEGKVIELSWYGNTPVSLSLGGDFHYKRLHIISSQVSEIPVEMKSSYTFLSRKKLAEELISTINYLPLISKIIPFEELPDFFEKIRNNKPNNDFITVVKY